MDRNELIEALAGRLGDSESAAEALDAVLAEIRIAVAKGDTVSIRGFGVFETRRLAARTALDPRTGATVKIPARNTLAFQAEEPSGAGGGASRIAKTKRGTARTRAKKSAPAKKALASPPPGPDFDTDR